MKFKSGLQKYLLIFVIFTVAILLQAQKRPSWSVYFSSHGGCADAILKELNKAKSSILVQAYSFTSPLIVKALVTAHKRGVKVEVIVDKSQRTKKYSPADFMSNQGIPTRINAVNTVAHNRVMIIDGKTLITGSFNFTKPGEEKNVGDLMVIRDKSLAATYVESWKVHWEHSEPYARRGR